MGNYVLITGGELRNKGAQAMTFITVDEIKKRYPDKKIILLSSLDYKRPQEEKDNYTFEILPFPSDLMILQSKIVTKIASLFKKDRMFKRFSSILADTDALIDISGYTFGSNWGARHSFYFLLRFRMAKVWSIPFYLMPQSFGPFDFKGKHAPFIKHLCKHTLNKAKIIMARENDGKEGLEKEYGLKNVILAPDLVLQNNGLSAASVYNSIPELFDTSVPENSVALVPNSKNIKYSSEDMALSTYKSIINTLLNKNKNVYLLYHAVEDKAVCKKLKEAFSSNASVVFVENELSCIEFENFIQKFQFVIASRFHSIVLSYKMYVPAVILGWAIKYKELSAKLSQEDYCFDIRNCDFTKLEHKVECMCENFAIESQKIRDGLSEIQKGNVYDYLPLLEKE